MQSLSAAESVDAKLIIIFDLTMDNAKNPWIFRNFNYEDSS